MKYVLTFMLIGTMLLNVAFIRPVQPSIDGAWKKQTGTVEETLVFQDNYFSYASFDKTNKQFIRSFGGKAVQSGKQVTLSIEYDTKESARIGQSSVVVFSQEGNDLQFDPGTGNTTWARIDNGKAPLAGNWRITGRLNNGAMSTIQRGDRKTLKLLSGTRFQWMAINPATREFFGTGGGRYTFENGVYTEHIEFFSRDSTRVGASLSFTGKVTGDTWEHSGKSSKGDPLQEVWSRDK